jgi:hypothetical protein
MATIAIVCKLAVIHSTTELNLDAWAEHFGVERDSDIFQERYKRVLSARKAFHDAWATAQANLSRQLNISLIQAEEIIREALGDAYRKNYRIKEARGL